MITINATIYDQSGRIVRVVSATQEVVELNVQPGQSYIEGQGRPDDQYVKNGEIVDMPPKPSEDYVFDYASKSWMFDTQGATNRALFKRNTLLADGPDRINPLWWASMTPAQQTAWESYRQALLDITNQPGFPMTIDWPNKPE